MADLFDRFSGSAGELASASADQGGIWGPSGADLISLTGSGAAYASGTFSSFGQIEYSAWTPPGTDYEAWVVVGTGLSGSGLVSPAVRCSGAAGSVTGYLLYCDTVPVIQIQRIVAGSPTVLATAATPPTFAAGDTIKLRVVTSGSTVNLTAIVNATVVATAADTDASRITATGSAGLLIIEGASQDMARAFWAGAIGGPDAGVSPASASVDWSGTQAFAATGNLTHEVLNWTVIDGSQTGSPGASITYTAPGSGASDSVTWTSADLPLHTAAASITLMDPNPPRRKRGGNAERRAKFIAGLKVQPPERLHVIKSTPPPAVARVTPPAPPERPAVSDARLSKAKLDFPIGRNP